MTQEQLAEAASSRAMTVSQAMISALEKRDSETTTALFALARALKINPEWLQTGQPENDSGLEAETGWKPASAELEPDEKELMLDYSRATPGWKLSLRLLARTPIEEQPKISRDLNLLLTAIFGSPAPDQKLGDRWTRPDVRQPPKDKP